MSEEQPNSPFELPGDAPHNGESTSIEAAEAIKPLLTGLRAQIFKVLETAEDGLTCAEVEQMLGIKHQTCSPRLKELVEQVKKAKFCFDPDGEPIKRRSPGSRSKSKVYYPVL
jgi:hypothetical protein